MSHTGLNHPFGEECCEFELAILQNEYQAYYFNEAPFNRESLDISTYLLIGRRGTGKSSLAEYFKFQQTIRNAHCIDVDEPEVYQQILTQMSRSAGKSPEIARMRLVQVWEFLLWSLIFEAYKGENDMIRAAVELTEPKGASRIISAVLKSLMKKFLLDTGELGDELENFITSEVVERAKNAVLQAVRHKPVIVAIDTLERYDLEDQPMLQALSALIQTASNFNIRYSTRGIHVKAFIPAEIYPYLAESEITNSAKYIRNPVFLQWRPKDLVRLVSWRYYLYLRKNRLIPARDKEITWASFPEVEQHIWLPYMGEDIINSNNLAEKTFPYVLRHTQMRPRQLIIILNKVAKLAKRDGSFPFLKQDHITQGIREAEIELATEVINSYSRIYPGLARILDALRGFPVVFKGNLLDKHASRTKSAWEQGDYSPYKFKQILAELGVVGELRNWDASTHIIQADFEYHLRDRLVLNSDSYYVIHPMFSRKLQIANDKQVMVYPFPNHPDYQRLG